MCAPAGMPIRMPPLVPFAHSQKHVGLYQRFGFWPRFLTAIMSKQVEQTGLSVPWKWTRFSEVPEAEREALLNACRQFTDELHWGLDVSGEINAVANQELGDTVLLWRDEGLVGLAVCHCGPGTEAGSGTCYVKFGAARLGPAAEQDFERLLEACEELALLRGMSRLAVGVNTARCLSDRRLEVVQSKRSLGLLTCSDRLKADAARCTAPSWAARRTRAAGCRSSPAPRAPWRCRRRNAARSRAP